MNPSQPTSRQELLRRYLRGEVGPREEAELRALAREDDALAEALAGIDANPEVDHLAALDRVRAQLPRQEASRRPLVGLSMRRIAAAAILLLAVGGALWYLPQALRQQDAAFSQNMETEGAAPAEAPTDDPVPNQEEAPLERLTETEAPAIEEEALQYTLEEEFADASEILADEEPVSAPAAIEPIPEPATSLAEPPPPPAGVVLDGIALQENTAPAQEEDASHATDQLGRARRQDEAAPSIAAPSAPPAAAGGAGNAEADLAQAAGEGPQIISGRVTDQDGNAITGADVRLPGAALGETTNEEGYFSFQGDATIRQLVIEADGFESLTYSLPQVERVSQRLETRAESPRDESGVSPSDQLSLDDDASTNTIQLRRINRPREEDLDLTSGTIIYPNDQPSIVRVEGGMRALRQAVLDNKPVELGTGRVRISFRIQENGSLTDFDLRGDASPELQNYVRSYLQQYTEWRVISGEDPASVSIRFRFD